eukprot:gnl/MRDRNA2_/MRDRNA2_57188_c0_seq1.p1 gnl/MRDRNA2_/MRDRNA2_57188_c0~~gnl/MRDRNA2_/MRDRNA2_57188_c0_seq1.p1  ORF type:complete len:318 (+),score=114.86 gnl/MRDRNA2_/MRDRNA2_57188_c0_seq1:131-1084(+)
MKICIVFFVHWVIVGITAKQDDDTEGLTANDAVVGVEDTVTEGSTANDAEGEEGNAVHAGDAEGESPENAEQGEAPENVEQGEAPENVEHSSDADASESEEDDPEDHEDDEVTDSHWFKEELISKDDLLKLHNQWDHDGDGKVSMKDVLKFANKVHVDMAKKNVNENMKVWDKSQDGRLTWQEAVDAFDTNEHDDDEQIEEQERVAREAQGKEKLQERFRGADVDGDGELSGDELSHFFHPEMHEHSLKKLAEETLKKRDKDGNGKLTEMEFLNLHEDENPEMLLEGHREEFQQLDKWGWAFRYSRAHALGIWDVPC